jgi:hypothetical protein
MSGDKCNLNEGVKVNEKIVENAEKETDKLVKELVQDVKDSLKDTLKKKKKVSGGGMFNLTNLTVFASLSIATKLFFQGYFPEMNKYCEEKFSEPLKNKIKLAGKRANELLDIMSGSSGGCGPLNKSKKKYRGGSNRRDSNRRDSNRRDSNRRDSNRRDSFKRDSFKRDSKRRHDESVTESPVKLTGTYTGDKNEKGEKNGQGKMEYTNGDIYEGSWKNDVRDGKGKIIFENKSSYDGTWSDDTMNGHGIFTYFNGDVYDGIFEDGNRSGDGKMSYENGEKYIGQWKDDVRYGKGKMTYKNGNAYEGKWRKDKREGYGKLIDPKGALVEEGEYVDDSLPLSVDNINNAFGAVTSQIERVTESPNAKKFKEMMGKATDWASKCTKEDFFNYVGAFIAIFDILQSLWTGGCIVKDSAIKGGEVDNVKHDDALKNAASFLSRPIKTFDQLKNSANSIPAAGASITINSVPAAATSTSSSITINSNSAATTSTKLNWREDTLFCLFLNGMLDSFKHSKWLFDNTLKKTFGLFDNTLKKTFGLIDNKITSTVTESGFYGNILFFVMASGFVAFLGLIVYATYSYINMSFDDHEKIKEDLRKRYRKRSTRKYK